MGNSMTTIARRTGLAAALSYAQTHVGRCGVLPRVILIVEAWACACPVASGKVRNRTASTASLSFEVDHEVLADSKKGGM